MIINLDIIADNGAFTCIGEMKILKPSGQHFDSLCDHITLKELNNLS